MVGISEEEGRARAEFTRAEGQVQCDLSSSLLTLPARIQVNFLVIDSLDPKT